MTGERRAKNRLASESSPYLLQHAGNPVEWYPWGQEAFERAKREDKPVFLSIGYSACHWCHVMARESFEDADTADYLNRNFVSIKVDREERPDIDHVYMQAVQALTGRGGWPLSAFLTPGGLPFFGGTYFPPENRYGLPGFQQVLATVRQAYADNRDDIERNGRELMAALSQEGREAGTAREETGLLDRCSDALKKEFDNVFGGFGSAPKFPEPIVLEFLLRSYFRTGDRQLLSMVELTLAGLQAGGIHDQLGGGFHRYSTDNTWLVPHFEKMLYDNALISRLFLHAFQVTGASSYIATACSTLDYLLREMKCPGGGFYAAQDADSDGAEGKFYVWTRNEVMRVLGEKEGEAFAAYFGVTAGGNHDGASVLSVAKINQSRHVYDPSDAAAKLLEERSRRTKPQTDTKLIASWNGMAMASLAEAAAITGRDDYLEAAAACAKLLTGPMCPRGHLVHIYAPGAAGGTGFLEDYASVIEGLLELHAATWDARWMDKACSLTEMMLQLFVNPADGQLYDDATGSAALFMRPRNVIDGAVPSGNSMAALVLLKMYDLTGNDRYRLLADSILGPLRSKMAGFPRGLANWLCAQDYLEAERVEIAICGARESTESRDMMKLISGLYRPNTVIAARDMSRGSPADVALLHGRMQVGGNTTAYVCKGRTCQQPVTDTEGLKRLLEGRTA